MSIKLTNIFAAQLLLKEEYKVFLKNYLTTKTHYFCPIEETINYNTILSNDYSLYDEWLINTKQLEHSSESFKKLINEYNKCLEEIRKFRALHLEFAATYIHKQSQIENPFGRGGSTITGTGGTPFMKYLKKHRDETQKQKINN